MSFCCCSSVRTQQLQYKKNAKANLSYTTVVDRPDIRKATQAAKLISGVNNANNNNIDNYNQVTPLLLGLIHLSNGLSSYKIRIKIKIILQKNI